jgi:hypothetical protein
MKTARPLLFLILFGFLSGTCAFSQQEMDANRILLESQIHAANGHYKTVLTSIADRRMNAKITKNADEREQINHEIAILVEDRDTTEEEIRILVDRFNDKKLAQPAVRRPTAEDAWNALLAAMQDGRMSEMGNLITERGLASLQARAAGEKEAAFRRWGAIWAKWPLHWRTMTDDHATAVMGPEVKEHTLEFIRTAQGWRLDEWKPGE